MKRFYIVIIALMLSIVNINAQHTKKAHRAAKKVNREARLTRKDHGKAVKLEKKRVTKHGV